MGIALFCRGNNSSWSHTHMHSFQMLVWALHVVQLQLSDHEPADDCSCTLWSNEVLQLKKFDHGQ